ncbi:unnamed protein product [Adineta ricciae]|uniref:Uncharacterized protein n=1 Tax=Adineta ricciae TaxID=249248 RepID=A0A815W0K0_ADIRI|nr:unnamed protein product [Adineta ricciae]
MLDLTTKILFVFICISIQSSVQNAHDEIDYADDDSASANDLLPLNSTTKIKPSPDKTTVPSTILTTLSTTTTTRQTRTTSVVLKNQSTTLRSRLITAAPIAPYILANTIVDQFNHYRNVDILARIKQCDSKFKLSDMCEVYTIDNHTYSVIREANIGFQSLQQVHEILVDRSVTNKLNTFCSPGEWCLGNVSQEDIRFTANVLRQRGPSFCALEKCRQRLTVFVNTCPTLASINTSAPTVKLLPMLCTLYKEPQAWNSNGCVKQIVHLLHIVYAFWPQVEECHRTITANSGGCTANCLAFDRLLRKVQSQCSPTATFLSRNDYESSSRRFDDDYEYTRLHDSTFELGANTEIPNSTLSSNNESSFDIRNNHHQRSSEHQRLLYMDP